MAMWSIAVQDNQEALGSTAPCSLSVPTSSATPRTSPAARSATRSPVAGGELLRLVRDLRRGALGDLRGRRLALTRTANPTRRRPRLNSAADTGVAREARWLSHG